MVFDQSLELPPFMQSLNEFMGAEEEFNSWSQNWGWSSHGQEMATAKAVSFSGESRDEPSCDATVACGSALASPSGGVALAPTASVSAPMTVALPNLTLLAPPGESIGESPSAVAAALVGVAPPGTASDLVGGLSPPPRLSGVMDRQDDEQHEKCSAGEEDEEEEAGDEPDADVTGPAPAGRHWCQPEAAANRSVDALRSHLHRLSSVMRDARSPAGRWKWEDGEDTLPWGEKEVEVFNTGSRNKDHARKRGRKERRDI
ncbi:hypothetical protein BHE74_00014956 [Ensete ventricosum]|nr:hypothetical protein GW17_00000891 [Ensete ventricosum]RWW76921.1 hypothetical protein BHE74_00014956 [Ensete ventricosum]